MADAVPGPDLRAPRIVGPSQGAGRGSVVTMIIVVMIIIVMIVCMLVAVVVFVMAVGLTGATDGDDVERHAVDRDFLGKRERLGIDPQEPTGQRIGHEDAVAGNGKARARIAPV